MPIATMIGRPPTTSLSRPTSSGGEADHCDSTPYSRHLYPSGVLCQRYLFNNLFIYLFARATRANNRP